MTIRPARPKDLPAIAAIQAASPEASQWKPEDYLGYDCLCAFCPLPDGRGSAPSRDRQGAAAFIVTRQLAAGEHEILNLAVAPEARRGGLARALLDHVLQAPGDWYLEVRASNTAAIRLYESTGFRPAGTRPGYYQGSSESAIVMRYQK